MVGATAAPLALLLLVLHVAAAEAAIAPVQGPLATECTCETAGGAQIKILADVRIPYPKGEYGWAATLPIPTTAEVTLNCDPTDLTLQVLKISWDSWSESGSVTFAPITTTHRPVTATQISTEDTTLQPTHTTQTTITEPTKTTVNTAATTKTTIPTKASTAKTSLKTTIPTTLTDTAPTTENTAETTQSTFPTEDSTAETSLMTTIPTTLTDTAPTTENTAETTQTTFPTEASTAETSLKTTIPTTLTETAPTTANTAETAQSTFVTVTTTSDSETTVMTSPIVQQDRVKRQLSRHNVHYVATNNEVQLWLRRDNSSFFVSKFHSRFRVRNVDDVVYLYVHTSNVKSWVTPLKHTIFCESERGSDQLGDSTAGMLTIYWLRLGAFLSQGCAFPDAPYCPWNAEVPADNSDSISKLSGVFIAGIVLGCLSVGGLVWLGARRIYLSVTR